MKVNAWETQTKTCVNHSDLPKLLLGIKVARTPSNGKRFHFVVACLWVTSSWNRGCSLEAWIDAVDAAAGRLTFLLEFDACLVAFASDPRSKRKARGRCLSQGCAFVDWHSQSQCHHPHQRGVPLASLHASLQSFGFRTMGPARVARSVLLKPTVQVEAGPNLAGSEACKLNSTDGVSAVGSFLNGGAALSSSGLRLHVPEVLCRACGLRTRTRKARVGVRGMGLLKHLAVNKEFLFTTLAVILQQCPLLALLHLARK